MEVMKKKHEVLNAARLYAILDTGWVAPDAYCSTARALLAGGADVVQLRAKNESIEVCARILDTLLPLFENGNVPLILNDHIELACKYPGLGVHLGQEDADPLWAREQLGEDAILGYSTHSLAQAQEAIALTEVIDYFAVGPVFATPIKPEYGEVGLELVTQVAGLQSALPFFCIGGIKASKIPALVNAGGKRVVVISELLEAEDVESATRRLKSTSINPLHP